MLRGRQRKIYSHISRVFESKKLAQNKGSTYMRVEKYIEFNGHKSPDFRLHLGGRHICEVDL